MQGKTRNPTFGGFLDSLDEGKNLNKKLCFDWLTGVRGPLTPCQGVDDATDDLYCDYLSR